MVPAYSGLDWNLWASGYAKRDGSTSLHCAATGTVLTAVDRLNILARVELYA